MNGYLSAFFISFHYLYPRYTTTTRNKYFLVTKKIYYIRFNGYYTKAVVLSAKCMIDYSYF